MKCKHGAVRCVQRLVIGQENAVSLSHLAMIYDLGCGTMLAHNHPQNLYMLTTLLGLEENVVCLTFHSDCSARTEVP